MKKQKLIALAGLVAISGVIIAPFGANAEEPTPTPASQSIDVTVNVGSKISMEVRDENKTTDPITSTVRNLDADGFSDDLFRHYIKVTTNYANGYTISLKATDGSSVDLTGVADSINNVIPASTNASASQAGWYYVAGTAGATKSEDQFGTGTTCDKGAKCVLTDRAEKIYKSGTLSGTVPYQEEKAVVKYAVSAKNAAADTYKGKVTYIATVNAN